MRAMIRQIRFDKRQGYPWRVIWFNARFTLAWEFAKFTIRRPIHLQVKGR